MQICNDCKHFLYESQYDHKRGECRFDPPRVIDQSLANRWPLVYGSDWCGKFEERASHVKS